METRHGSMYRQLHIEDYLREIPTKQGRVSGVYAHEWITRGIDTNADLKVRETIEPRSTERYATWCGRGE